MQELDVKNMDLNTLLVLYKYVSEVMDRAFGNNAEGRAVIKSKFVEVETEVHNRVFGGNPFKLGTVFGKKESLEFVRLGTIEGVQPESIDLKQFDEPEKARTVVVSGDKQASIAKVEA